MINVEQIRAQIPVTKSAVYLNTGWSGPSPQSVVDAITAHLQLELQDGPASQSALKAQREIMAHSRELVAGLLNVTPDEISLTENTTEGINVVLNGLKFEPGDEAITFGIEHSSVLIPTLFLKREGVSVKVIPVEPDETPEGILEKLRAAVSRRTQLLTLSHIEYSSGIRMPVKEMCAIVQPLGAHVLVDGAQAFGQIAIDLAEIPVDYYAMPGQKWLLGPDGTGALFVRKERIASLQPRKVAGSAGSYDREAGRFEEKTESIRKFELTTQSPALRAGFNAALGFIQAAGLPEIEARNAGLASRFKDAISEVTGVELITPRDPALTSGLVAFRIAGMAPQDAVTALWERWRIAARAVTELGAVRVSLHFFNTEAEIDKTATAVEQLANEAHQIEAR